ncbi:MAG: hypothetical protein JSS02_32095 [Planctomycetes bacterium]|nr:hypothetical protein [Planctomycetota bacterium]
MKNFVMTALLLESVIGGKLIDRGSFSVNHAQVKHDETAITDGVHDLQQEIQDKASHVGHTAQDEKK